MIEFISNSAKQTEDFAKKFAKKVKCPQIILLHGDLGAGKTHFTKGFAKGVGFKHSVTSPTFTIMNSYEGGRYTVYHFDMYRLSSADEAREAGLEDYFNKKTLKGVSIVEWPQNVSGLIDLNSVINITIEKLEDENSRLITIKGE